MANRVAAVMAVSQRDTSRIVMVEVERDGSFNLRLEAGTWRIRAFQDLDQNRRWDPVRERASAPHDVIVEPAARIPDVHFDIRTRRGGP